MMSYIPIQSRFLIGIKSISFLLEEIELVSGSFTSFLHPQRSWPSTRYCMNVSLADPLEPNIPVPKANNGTISLLLLPSLEPKYCGTKYCELKPKYLQNLVSEHTHFSPFTLQWQTYCIGKKYGTVALFGAWSYTFEMYFEIVLDTLK